MRQPMYAKKLHVISTAQQTMEVFVQIAGMIHQEVDAIHLREKEWTAAEHVQVIQLLEKRGVPLEKIIVNDRVDIAYIMKTAGVQLGYRSIDTASVRKAFPKLQIGSSIHTTQEALEAEEKGADYLLYGHIYPTPSKPGIVPRGVAQLRRITQCVTLPVIAIGGISPENTRDTLAAGAGGIAVLSGILLADDPMQAVRDYREAMDCEEVFP